MKKACNSKKSGIVMRLLKSERGGIGEIIAMVVGIVLVLGLIAYAILGQVAGTKKSADKALNDQNRLNRLMQEADLVTGNDVKNYIDSPPSQCTVTVVDAGNNPIARNSVVDGDLFRMQKTYTNGTLTAIRFTQTT